MRKITNEELNRPSAGEFAAMEKMPVAVVLDNVRSLQNVGAFFRTATRGGMRERTVPSVARMGAEEPGS